MTWGIDAVRNYPRGPGYRLGLQPLERGNNCYLCQESSLVGIAGAQVAASAIAAVVMWFVAKRCVAWFRVAMPSWPERSRSARLVNDVMCISYSPWIPST